MFVIEAIKVFIFIKYVCVFVLFLSIFTYSIGDTSWKDCLDDNTAASSTHDSESKTATIIDQIYYLNLCPFRVQLQQYQHINSIWRVWSIRHLSSSLSYPLVNKEISQELWREIEWNRNFNYIYIWNKIWKYCKTSISIWNLDFSIYCLIEILEITRTRNLN